ncbi:ABC transporter substrate-binding protein [Chelatococcus sp. GCM10030263]|uniref:ABC transporter substrate-binding protein n=1 Tax=Chelatococcus sp. GCM10030263 TaxID=3273387 RepID=UPI00360B2EDA
MTAAMGDAVVLRTECGVDTSPRRAQHRRKTMTRRSLLAGLAGFGGVPAASFARGAPPALRIAVTDWAAAESLLAIGVAPLAVPDIAVYRQWLREIPLPPSVVDLGSRAEPNLELLASLAPDRILVSNWQRSLVALFRRIAPTETITIIGGRSDAYANARAALVQVADLVNRPDAAPAYLGAFDRALASFTRALEGQYLPPVYVAVLHENGTQLFAYGRGSWVDDVIRHLGLSNALRQPTSAFGNALIGLAELAGTPEALLLYLDQGERTRRAERSLATSTVWRSLPMVRAGRVHRIPPFYALGGVPSVWRCGRLITSALAGLPEASRE